jgi:NTE family protein
MSGDVVVALGGGGAKGNPHIGVLKVLEREGFRIRAIAGTSAGGMAAAVYAAGYSPDEIEAHMTRVDQGHLFGSRPDGPGLLGIKGVVDLLLPLLGERTFDDLRIPCALTAVDLETGQEVVLKDGRVLDAVMATIAIPGIFPPKKWGDYLLIDGGVMDPVPVGLAREISPLRGLPVVAVVLSPSLEKRRTLPTPGFGATAPLLKRIARLRVAQAFDIFLRSVDISIIGVTETRLQLERPEVVIRPDVGHVGYLERVNVSDVVRLGEQAAEAALPQIRRAVHWSRRLARRLGGGFR